MKKHSAWVAIALMILTTISDVAADDCHGDIIAKWLKDGRNMMLTEDYVYVDPHGTRWQAPKGSKTDGASIPPFLWSFIGGPFEGRYRDAAVVHDVACQLQNRPWRDVHRMFFDAMLCDRVEASKAKAMYWAVYNCGPRWGKDQGTRWFPCRDSHIMSQLLAAVECAVTGCSGSVISFASATGATLHDLERLTPDALKNEPQIADLDLREPLIPDSPDNRVLVAEATEALRRAQEEGVLANGKVVFRDTFTEDRIKFKLGSYELDKNAQVALDDFSSKVKALNEQYYIEIQGHTDDTGSRHFNDELGQRRADEVRRYLSRRAQLPLNRMSTISYGDALPVAPNKTKKGRAENRRVVIVVLE